MSKIKLKAFSGIIYKYLSPYISEYLTNELTKESFTEMMNSGTVKMNNIQTKPNFITNIFYDINLISVLCSNLEIKVPDEKQNLQIKGNNLSLTFQLAEVTPDEILQKLRKEQKNLYDNFIQFAVDLIAKNKKGPFEEFSFIIDYTMKNLLKNALIDFEQIKICFVVKNQTFVFIIEKINLCNDSELTVNNISLLLQKNAEISIIKNFDINCKLISEEENTKYSLNVNFSKGLVFEINTEIFQSIEAIKQLIILNKENYQKQRKQKFIEYIVSENLKKEEIINYKNLWKSSICSVKMLNKSKKNNNYNLSYHEEKLMYQDFITNKKEDNIFLIKKEHLLNFSKSIVKKKVIEGKKNQFFSFFSKNEDKLTPEETIEFDKIFNIDGLSKYLKGELKKEQAKASQGMVVDFLKKIKKICFSLPQFVFSLTNQFIWKENVSLIIYELNLNLVIEEAGKKMNAGIRDIKISYNSVPYDLLIKNHEDNIININIDEKFNIDKKLNFNEIVMNECYIKAILNYILIITQIFKFDSFSQEINTTKTPQVEQSLNWLIRLLEENKLSFPIVSFVIEDKIKFSFYIGDIIIKKENDSIYHVELSIEIQEIFSNTTVFWKTPFTLTVDTLKNMIYMTSEHEVQIYIKKKYITEMKQLMNYFKMFGNRMSSKKTSNNEKIKAPLSIQIALNTFIIQYDEDLCVSFVKCTSLNINYYNNTLTPVISVVTIVTNKHSPLFLDFVTILLTYDPNAQIKSSLDPNDLKELQLIFPSSPLKEEDLIISFKADEFNFNIEADESTILFSFKKLKFDQNKDKMKIDAFTPSLFLQETPSKNSKFTLYESKNEMIIDYNLNTNNCKMNIDNLIVYYDTVQFSNLIKAFTLDLHIQIVLVDFIFNVLFRNLVIRADEFNVRIEQIDIRNSKQNINLINIHCVNFTINKFLYSYGGGDDNEKTETTLVKDNKIDINFLNVVETNIAVVFSKPTVRVTQGDLYNILLLIDFSKLKDNSEAKADDLFSLKEKYTDIQMSTINFEIVVPEIILTLTIETVDKISKISMKNISFYYTLLTYDNKYSDQIKLSIAKIELNYFDRYKTEYLLLSTNKGNQKETVEGNYQFEITKKHQECLVKISSTKILLRLDAYLLLYYFVCTSVPFEQIYDKVKDIKPRMTFKVDLFNSTFLLQTSLDSSQILVMNIDKIDFMYQNTKDETPPYGSVFVHINQIESKVASKHQERNFFITKNDFLIIRAAICPKETPSGQDTITFTYIVGDLSLNLAYSDFVSVLKVYKLNMFYIENETRVNIVDFYLKKIEEDKKKSKTAEENEGEIMKAIVNGEFQLNLVEITFIDNSNQNFFPFMQVIFNPIYAEVEDQKIVCVLSFLVNSFNYIARVWEPNVEKCGITIESIISFVGGVRNAVIDIKNENRDKDMNSNENFLINISDMNISFVLKSLSNWLDQYFKEISKTEAFFINFKKNAELLKNANLYSGGKELLSKMTSAIIESSSISNNQVMNYTGESLLIKYKDSYLSSEPNSSALLLEYSNEIEDFGSITLLYNNKEYIIPINKFCARIHRINQNDFFVSETSLSKARSIDIAIYSPIVFSNKTQEAFTIVCTSETKEEYYIVIEPNTIKGVPFSYLQGEFFFLDDKQFFTFTEIFNTGVKGFYKKNITTQKKKKVLMLLLRDIPNVRNLALIFEYSVVNCLPWKIFVRFQSYQNKVIEIEKCHQMDMDFILDGKVSFEFLINGELYATDYEDFYRSDQPPMTFANQMGSKITLPYLMRQKNMRKELIIYSEYLISNVSGLEDIVIHSKDKKNNKNVIIKIENNLYLIPSLEVSFMLEYQSMFFSPNLQLKSLIEASKQYDFRLKKKTDNKNIIQTEYYDLRIAASMSYITIQNYPSFSETISTLVFEILPICTIFNFLPDKAVVLKDFGQQQLEQVQPLSKKSFHFFGRGKNIKLNVTVKPLKNNTEDWKVITFNSIGKHTLFIEDFFLNIEIRENNYNNVIEVYFREATLETGEIVIENKSDKIIVVTEEGFEDKYQIIDQNAKEICKLYSTFEPILNIESNSIYQKIELNSIKERKNISLNKILILSTDSNGINKKLTFYNYEDYYNIRPETQLTKFTISLPQIIITLIGDNEFYSTKLRNYTRKELILIILEGVYIEMIQKKNLTLKNKYNILDLVIKDINLCNQTGEFGKFPLALYNSTRPFFSLKSEYETFKNDKISKIHSLSYNFAKMSIGIDPNFLDATIKFYKNIIYRMDLLNFNVNNIFLPQADPNTLKDEHDIFNSYLIQATNVIIPKLNFNFEISKFDLEKLLKEHFQCTSFLCFIISNLAGTNHEISLSQNNLKVFIGTLEELIIKVLSTYQLEFYGKISGIGLKGFMLSFVNLFKQDEKRSNKVKAEQRRIPRVLYGRFKYIKNYNIDHAIIIKSTKKLKLFETNYFFTNAILGKMYVFVFTTLSMFILNSYYGNLGNIDYFYIESAEVDPLNSNKIIIKYNQTIDNRNRFEFDCKENIAKKVVDMLNEERVKYADEFLNLE